MEKALKSLRGDSMVRHAFVERSAVFLMYERRSVGIGMVTGRDGRHLMAN